MDKGIVTFLIIATCLGLFGFVMHKNGEKVGTFIAEDLSEDSNTSYQSNTYANAPQDSADRELQSVLNKIAGTYELTENLGIYGFRTVYAVKINRDGTGMMAYDTGDIENFFSARLSGSNKIVFNGNYGGTVFLLSGPGIEDESAKKELTEIGTPKYVMTKIR